MKYEIVNESEFEKLSRKLEPDERNALLQKIQKYKEFENIRLHSDKKESDYQKQYAYALNVYNHSDFIYKILIWIQSFFSGKKKELILINNMLSDVKNEIAGSYPELIDFNANSLTTKFGEKLLSFAEICNQLLPNINYFFQDPIYYYSFLSYLIEKDFDDELKRLLTSLKPENFEMKSGEIIDKEIFFNEKDKRLKFFLNKISLITFDSIANFFTNFELIILLIIFDYKSLLINFVDNIEKGIDEKKIDNKKGVYFYNVEELLERFYILIESINFDYEGIKLIENMIEFSDKNPKDLLPDNNNFTENDLMNFKYLFNAINNLKSDIPFKSIFQYYKRNILYTPQKIDFHFEFISLYKEFKRNLINKEWNEYYNKLGEINLNKTMRLIFKDYNFNSLEYFTPDFKKSIEEKSAAKVKNVKKLNFLVKFLEEKYHMEVEKTINKILINGNFTKDTYRSNLSNLYYLMHNYNDKIRYFDMSLNENETMGSKISAYTKVVFTEIETSKVFQQLVKDINAISDKLAEDAFISLWNINLFLNNLSSTLVTSNVVLLNMDNIKIPGYINAKQALAKIKELFDIFFKIYNNLNN